MLKIEDVQRIIDLSYGHVKQNEPVDQLEALEKLMPLLEHFAPQERRSSFLGDLIGDLINRALGDQETIGTVMTAVVDALSKRKTGTNEKSGVKNDKTKK